MTGVTHMDHAASNRTATVRSADRDDETARSVKGWYDPDSTRYATDRDEREADRTQATEMDDESAWIDWN